MTPFVCCPSNNHGEKNCVGVQEKNDHAEEKVEEKKFQTTRSKKKGSVVELARGDEQDEGSA